jgi:hypothetical protein
VLTWNNTGAEVFSVSASLQLTVAAGVAQAGSLFFGWQVGGVIFGHEYTDYVFPPWLTAGSSFYVRVGPALWQPAAHDPVGLIWGNATGTNITLAGYTVDAVRVF